MNKYQIANIQIVKVVYEYCGRCFDCHCFIDAIVDGVLVQDINDFDIDGFDSRNYEDITEIGPLSDPYDED